MDEFSHANDGASAQATEHEVGRRQFLVGSSALIAAAVTPLIRTAAQAADQVKPNIVYIIADDLGWKDIGYHGSDIATPNLDKLAQDGARLETYYAQPLCTPTRAALMTGRYPLRYGLQTGVIPSGAGYGLPTDEYILPQMLKDAGYKTSMVGKWHLGHGDTAFWPRQRGFDYFYGALVGEIDHFKHASHGVKDWYRNNTPLNEEGFDNNLFGIKAAKVIAEHDTSAPLFLYLAFTAPHSPYQAPQEYLDRFANIEDEQRRTYAAMISSMDDEVGRVVAALEAAGMRENTLIVFQSDNGGVRNKMFSGEAAVAGDLPADNSPYREGKGTLYEGGTRVCGFVNWPGQVQPGDVNGMMHVVDMYPTLAGVAGAELGKNKPLDGMDVWGAIAKGEPSPRTEVVYNVDPTGGAIRQGDMKLVWTAALPPRVELFDLKADPVEANNIADKHPDLVKSMQDRITALAQEMAPPQVIMAAIKLTYGAPPVSADPSTLYSQGQD